MTYSVKLIRLISKCKKILVVRVIVSYERELSKYISKYIVDSGQVENFKCTGARY